MKYLGIDFGSKKIGLALSDSAGSVAFPHGLIKNDDSLLEQVEKIVEEEAVQAIVIGESKNFKGEDNPIMESVMDFIGQLSFTISIPIHLEKEFLSTAQARNLPDEGSARGRISRDRRKKQDMKVDAHAAAIILQSFLDKQK